MIDVESYLIASGFGCGTLLNLNKEIVKNLNLGISQRWYFYTPVKVSGIGWRSATIDMRLPVLSTLSDENNESKALVRLNALRPGIETDLVNYLRSLGFTVPPDSVNISAIPYWSKLDGVRDSIKQFGTVEIHVFYANVTVKYRNLPEIVGVDNGLLLLQSEQRDLENKISYLTKYVAGSDYAALTAEQKLVITSQLEAMNDYNTCLNARITNY